MDYKTEFIGGDELHFVTTQPGEPYRLLPFGVIYKGGKKVDFTRELAEKVKLPHFKPPIKLGSHEETTPAGGQIVALEVRDDGLYAVPEYTEKGLQALADGDYRYQSPEVYWKAAFEDPKTGKLNEGTFIVGDALLHMPHLGEDAALYQSTPSGKDDDMEDENVSVPKSVFGRFEAWLDGLVAGKSPVATVDLTAAPVITESDEYKAAVSERDQFKAEAEKLKAEFDRQEAEKAVVALKASIVADLQNPEKYGSVWIELPKVQEAADMLASMTEEQRTWCTRNFSALAMQIDESALTAPIGSTGKGNDDPQALLHAQILEKAEELKISYSSALDQVRAEKPELFSAAYSRKE
jgi:hypothetical protein